MIRRRINVVLIRVLHWCGYRDSDIMRMLKPYKYLYTWKK